MKILSILIPHLTQRASMLDALLKNLYDQINDLNAHEQVEIHIEPDNGGQPTGTKRNILLQRSSGKYIVFVDDDDVVPDYYIKEILKAAESDADAFAIEGVITIDGGKELKWYISKDLPYEDSKDAEGNTVYLRYNNHISPIKRSIAIQVRFKPWYYREDYEWSTEIHKKKLIKTEHKIEPIMYYYKYISK